MTQDRIAARFRSMQEEGRIGLIVFLTAGCPDLESTRRLVPALAEAGADCIELGVPFSDPLAEGPTIQASSFTALQNGVTLADCVELVAELRPKVPETPLVLMGYYNPILRYGLSNFAKDGSQAGVDGVIVVDLPPDEAQPLMEQCRPEGIHIIPLLAPTSTDERIAAACESGSGFVYCVSLTGVTGARDILSSRVFPLLERVRRHTSLPLAVGFGISSREHIESLGKEAQAAAVGSAIVDVITRSPREEMVENTARYVKELSGRDTSTRKDSPR